MARLDQPIRKVSAIFIRSVSDGKETFTRAQFNIVSINWGDGSDIKTFQEPTGGRPISPSQRDEVYDEIRIYDNFFPGAQI